MQAGEAGSQAQGVWEWCVFAGQDYNLREGPCLENEIKNRNTYMNPHTERPHAAYPLMTTCVHVPLAITCEGAFLVVTVPSPSWP